MSEATVNDSTLSFSTEGNIGAGLRSTVFVSDWSGQPSTLPNIGSGGGLDCWEESIIFISQAAVQEDISNLPDLENCVVVR
jgi:hypothetical protein